MDNRTYDSTTTKRFVLRSNHSEWLEKTEVLYNDVLGFYYRLYLESSELHSGSSRQTMRELEKMSIVGRDKKDVSHPLPWERIPLYFRRSAINAAIAAGKSFLSREIQRTKTERFSEAVTFYKGMYKGLDGNGVELKVWDGVTWKWIHCRLSGNAFLEGEEQLSPSVVLNDKRAELHVPVKTTVSDGRKAKDRICAGERIAAVQFTNRDRLAVIAVLDSKGIQQAAHFVSGGTSYEHQCEKVITAIQNSEKAVGYKKDNQSNKKYWMKLKHLNEYYSHKSSREIVEYCAKQKVSVLVLPAYEEEYSRYVMCASGNWSALHLSGQIREKLKYKAWKAGMVVLETNPAKTGSKCAVCGQKIKKQGAEFECPGGHCGNRYLNAAVNLGRKCLISFGKQAE